MIMLVSTPRGSCGRINLASIMGLKNGLLSLPFIASDAGRHMLGDLILDLG